MKNFKRNIYRLSTSEMTIPISPGGHSYQANTGPSCDPLFYPYTIGISFPAPSDFGTMLSPHKLWSDIEYVEIMSVVSNPGLETKYNSIVVAPGLKIYPSSATDWVSSMTTTRNALDCTDISQVWGVRIKLFGYVVTTTTSFTMSYIESMCTSCIPVTYTYQFYDGSNQPGENATCTAYNPGLITVYSTSSTLTTLAVLYTDPAMTITYYGSGLVHFAPTENILITISAGGVITNVSSCVVPTCSSYELNGGINGRTFTYTDCNGVSQIATVPAGDSVPYCIRGDYPLGVYLGPC